MASSTERSTHARCPNREPGYELNGIQPLELFYQHQVTVNWWSDLEKTFGKKDDSSRSGRRTGMLTKIGCRCSKGSTSSTILVICKRDILFCPTTVDLPSC